MTPAYVRRHLAEHAAAGHVLEQVITPGIVPLVDVGRLRALPMSDRLPIMPLLRRATHAWAFDEPLRNAAALEFLAAAARHDLQGLFPCSWRVVWAKASGQSEIVTVGRDIVGMHAMTADDGRIVVATASATGVVVNDPATGRWARIHGPATVVVLAGLAPGRQTFAFVGDSGGTVHVVPVPDEESGASDAPDARRPAFQGTSAVTALASWPSAGRVLVGRQNGLVSLLDVSSGSPALQRGSYSGRIVALAALPRPNGDAVALSLAADGRLGVWDPGSGDYHEIPLALRPTALTTVTLRDGTSVAVVAGEARAGATHVLVCHPGGTHRPASMYRQDVEVTALVAYPGMDRQAVIVLGDAAGRLRLLDLEDGRLLTDPIDGHTSAVLALSCAPTDSGRPLVFSAAEDSTRSWDLEPALRAAEAHKTRGNATPEHLGGRRHRYFLRTWRLDDGQEMGVGTPTHTHWLRGSAVAQLSDDHRVVVTLETGETVSSSEDPGVLGVRTAQAPGASPLAVTCSEDTLHVWDLAPLRDRRPATASPVSVTHAQLVAFAVCSLPDGTSIAVTSAEPRTVRFWDLGTGCQRLPEQRPGVVITALAAAANRDRAVVVGVSRNTSLHVWDAATGQETSDFGIPQVPQHAVTALDAAFVDGDLVCVAAIRAGGGRTVRILPLGAGRGKERVFEGHTGAVTAVAIAGQSRSAVLVTAATDRTVRVWDLRTGRAVVEPLPVPGTVWSISCPDDRPGVVIAGEDVFAYVRWDLLSKGDSDGD